MTLVLPHTIDAGTEVVAAEHQENYVAIRDAINALPAASDVLAPWYVLEEATFSMPGSSLGVLAPTTDASIDPNNMIQFSSGSTLGRAWKFFPFRAADIAAPGFATHLRLRMATIVNSVAPARTFTGGLYTVAADGSGSGVSLNGANVPGLSVTRANPAAKSENIDVGAEVTIMPADGIYYLGMSLSGATATNSGVEILLQLMVKHV